MKSRLVLAAMILGLIAPMTALAQCVDLKWNGCGTAGELDNAFACHINTPLHHLVSSFIAPPGITRFIGATTEMIVDAFPTTLPAWWQLQEGGCRAGTLSSEDPSVLGLGNCSSTTFDGSTNIGLANYVPNFSGNPGWGRITVDMARTDLGVALDAGTEYQANIIQIRSTKSTGTTACAGCVQQVAIRTVGVFVAEPDGVVELVDTGDACASWRGGNCGHDGDCFHTPTRRQSWGEVKSLYR